MEFVGAVYDVISRDNYRKERFVEGSARLFFRGLCK